MILGKARKTETFPKLLLFFKLMSKTLLNSSHFFKFMPSFILCLVEKAQAQYQIVKAFKKLLQFFLLTNSARKSSKFKKIAIEKFKQIFFDSCKPD